jgi:hypothetical protein
MYLALSPILNVVVTASAVLFSGYCVCMVLLLEVIDVNETPLIDTAVRSRHWVISELLLSTASALAACGGGG